LIFLFVLGTAALFFSYYRADIIASVQTAANVLKNCTNEEIEKAGISSYLRMTLMTGGGNVIYDTHSDYRSMDSHIARREVIDAVNNGSGEAFRRSDTSNKNMYYYAVRLENSNILRVSREIAFSPFFNIIIFFALFTFMISFLIAGKLSNRIVEPIVSGDFKIYDELLPLVVENRELLVQISQYDSKVKNDENTFRKLLDSAKEGIIFLDSRGGLINVNKSAIRMLEGNSDGVSNLLELTREPVLQSAVKESAETGYATAYLKKNGNDYEISVSNSGISVTIIILDITEKKKAETARRDFSSNVSHELKTPLTVIKGFSEMLSKELITEKNDIIKYSGDIYKEAERLLYLINHIIKLSEIEEAPGETDFEAVSLKGAVFVSMAALKGIFGDIKVTCDCDESVVFGNKTEISELIANLLENAVKYNKKGGSVTVLVKNNVLKVSDTGIGIPSDHIGRVFERFYRVDKSRSKATGGTGLGLSIVKHIAERHNSVAEIESEVGVGTVVTVDFSGGKIL
jgi:two-component system phosphate regulon sensor histidine kinase PhoR